MCRYGLKKYKDHYACFDCRKTFKQPFRLEPTFDMTSRGIVYKSGQNVLRLGSEQCPECKKTMHHIGHDFQAPKRSKVAQWEKVRQLVLAGFKFHSCGCGGPGERPRHLREVPEFLQQNRSLDEGQRLLETFSHR
jgi:hypothetical protein